MTSNTSGWGLSQVRGILEQCSGGSGSLSELWASGMTRSEQRNKTSDVWRPRWQNWGHIVPDPGQALPPVAPRLQASVARFAAHPSALIHGLVTSGTWFSEV